MPGMNQPDKLKGWIMNRITLEVGAFAWGRIQRLYDADSAVHWQRCAVEVLKCP
jgi:hypothetical protein